MPRGRPRKTPESTSQQTNRGSAGKGMTKTEAMRQALGDLGNDAKPLQLQEHIKSKFGIEMATSHISSAKTALVKESAGQSKPGHKPSVTVAPAPTSAKQPSGGISLADIRTVKELAERLGADKVRELTDLLSN